MKQPHGSSDFGDPDVWANASKSCTWILGVSRIEALRTLAVSFGPCHDFTFFSWGAGTKLEVNEALGCCIQSGLSLLSICPTGDKHSKKVSSTNMGSEVR